MFAPLVINWNPDPVLLHIGSFPLRYYGLLWVVGIACSYLIVRREYKDKQWGDNLFDPLFFYCFFGILLGARLGHCLFYEPGYFLNHISEMLLPIKNLPDGSWKFVGYQGLASHGGSLGLIISVYLYCRKYKIHFMDVADIIAVATPICAACIRLANLMNSEIIGKVTDVPWAFVFERLTTDPSIADPLAPRHPAQLYEALAYLCFAVMMYMIYRKKQQNLKRGLYFGLLLSTVFTFRFFIEFIKENQVGFEQGMTFNMGQLLSIPFIIIGIYFMCFYDRKGQNKQLQQG